MVKILQKAIKHRYLLSWLIAFFIGGIMYSFTCHAQAMPSIDTSTFSVIQGGNQNLIDVGFLPQNIIPYTPITTSAWSPWNIGYVALSSVDDNDITISLLSDADKATLLSSFNVVDVNGVSVTLNDNVYFVEYDNGYFTGQCYVDSEGKLLAYTDDLGGQLLQCKFGGGVKNVEDWEAMFDSEASDIYDNNYMIIDHPEYLTDASYYCFRGGTLSGNPGYATDFYIPNQYNPGIIVPVTNTNGSFINSWYCNGTPYYFTVRYGDVTTANTMISVRSGTYSKDGVSYTKQVTYNGAWNHAVNGDFDAWVNRTIPANQNLFANYGSIYSSTASSNLSSSIAFKPIQNPDGATLINYNYYYDYDSINRLEQQLNDLTNTLNQNFNNDAPLSDNNFPYYYPIGNTENNPSDLPFPNIENYPGYTPMPTPSTDPILDYGVVTQPTSQTILDSFSNLQIPFLQNVRYRFPFCIPWDIRDAVSLLKFSPTAPAWDFDWEITALGTTYTYHCVGDLSDYDSLALLFRRLMLCAVFIGLAFWTYKLML